MEVERWVKNVVKHQESYRQGKETVNQMGGRESRGREKETEKWMNLCSKEGKWEFILKISSSIKGRTKTKRDKECMIQNGKENLSNHLPLPHCHSWEVPVQPGQVILSITPLTHLDRQALHTFREYSQNVTLTLPGNSASAPCGCFQE